MPKHAGIAKLTGLYHRSLGPFVPSNFAFEIGEPDRDGIHATIRNCLAPHAGPIVDPPRQSTLASYCPDPPRSVQMYVEHVQSNMPLPDMPIFLNPERYVNVPLEATYLAWRGMPAFWRNVVCNEAASP